MVDLEVALQQVAANTAQALAHIRNYNIARTVGNQERVREEFADIEMYVARVQEDAEQLLVPGGTMAKVRDILAN